MVDVKTPIRHLTAFNVALVLVSGVLWAALWIFNAEVMSFTRFATGIDLVYLPAGYRLIIVLILGVRGALGITLADPLLHIYEFGGGSPLEVFAAAVISGFVPWITTVAFCRVARIRPSLIELEPLHLPLLALAVSLTTPLVFNVLFAVADHHSFADFGANYAAMATGDFLGCFIIIVFARLAIASGRWMFG